MVIASGNSKGLMHHWDWSAKKSAKLIALNQSTCHTVNGFNQRAKSYTFLEPFLVLSIIYVSHSELALSDIRAPTAACKILWLAIFIFAPALSNKAHYRHYRLVADVMRWLVHNGNPINQNSFRHQHEKDDAAAAKKSGVIVLSLSESVWAGKRGSLSLSLTRRRNLLGVVLQLADRGHVRESFNPFIANGLL